VTHSTSYGSPVHAARRSADLDDITYALTLITLTNTTEGN
jgi:hypothetical protein